MNPLKSMGDESNQTSGATDSVKSKEEQARLALQDELPTYIVESFMATGYDTLQVISKMDTSNSPGNSLEEIEQFISTELREDPCFARGITNRSVFKFLPGHCRRIIDFVNQIKSSMEQEEKAKWFKKKRLGDTSSVKFCAPATKVKRGTCGTEDPDDVVDQVKAVTIIQQQITKWQRTQSSSKLRELKETVHFDIKVALLKDSTNLSASVLCKICDKSSTLGFKGGTVLLSNWTRHIVKCVEKKKPSASKGNKIQNFFSHKVLSNTLPNSGLSGESFSAPDTSKVIHNTLANSGPSGESFSAAGTSKVIPSKLPNSGPSGESFSVPDTSKVIPNILPNSRPSGESFSAPDTSKVIPPNSGLSGDSESFSAPDTSKVLSNTLPNSRPSGESSSTPDTFAEVILEEKTNNFSGQVFWKPPPAHN